MRQSTPAANLENLRRAFSLICFALAITTLQCGDESNKDPIAKKPRPTEVPEPPRDEVMEEDEPNLQDAAPVVKRPMFLEFTSDSCLPCKLMVPWIAALKKGLDGRVDVVEIDILKKENKRTVQYFGIRSVPAQVLVDGRGTIVARNNGLATFEQMKKMIEKGLGIEIK